MTARDKIELTLLENSTRFLVGEINDMSIETIIKWITYENLVENKNSILTLYINSGGGNMYDAFALIDIMRSSKIPIRTVGVGTVMSAAFLIFASGMKGQRHIGRNTAIMCHQHTSEVEGKYHDVKAAIREDQLTNKRMMDVLKNCTNLDITTIKTKFMPASDVFFTAKELVEYGVADQIL
jgi:ATP-dependent Clp protease protease subunit